MTSKVGVIEFNGDPVGSLKHILDEIGGISDLNTGERLVVVKVGVFSHKAGNHTSVGVVDAIVKCFDAAPKIFLAESDNYRGKSVKRLQIWKELFTERVVPFSLSDDGDIRSVQIMDQKMDLSQILFKPNVLVDTHILRSFERGSILKNLFGCVATSKKVKYHKVLPTLLADVYEAIGGVDLAVLDGTHFWRGAGSNPVEMNTLVVGRDAVAVETVGATLAGLNPLKMPVIQEFVKRDLGEGDLRNIEVVGTPLEPHQKKFAAAVITQKKLRTQQRGPQTWGGRANHALEGLIREGFFDHPKKRRIEDVMKALEAKGLSTKGKEGKIASSLARRVKKGELQGLRGGEGWIYWTQ